MGLKEVMAKISSKFSREPEVYADNETRDRYLRSLRRERRIQLEQEEKIRLRRIIAEYNKKQREKHLWGMKENLLRQKNKFKPKRAKWM